MYRYDRRCLFVPLVPGNVKKPIDRYRYGQKKDQDDSDFSLIVF